MTCMMNIQQFLTNTGIHLLMVVMAGPLLAQTTSSSSDPDLRETTLIRLAPNYVLFTEDVLLEVSARSRIDCSKKCVETEGCVMCTFLSSPQGPPGHCRLHSHLQNLADGWKNTTWAKSLARRRGCDEGYELTCGRCLKAVDSKVKYLGARQGCSQRQGRLVMPKTSAEMDCVWKFMKDNGITMAWVGGNDMQEPGVFRWNDGTVLPDNSPLWGSGEPDKNNGGNDCFNLRATSSKLFDRHCEKFHYPYICQKDAA